MTHNTAEIIGKYLMWFDVCACEHFVYSQASWFRTVRFLAVMKVFSQMTLDISKREMCIMFKLFLNDPSHCNRLLFSKKTSAQSHMMSLQV